ncbi:MAG: hypothetical protein A3D24_00815 [Candidatus Blackburnbacteria bacterium RIFCSPHIGHO2_02_FULL_39_13]|uniref:SCP domain-containing protein n=1 Tax=Candidatus Blackburnbacteria bacterium RIFCSPLOWO2_01_FULL_40_20 TaxID=1797519 RepID=A0A1G1VE32_9BACT|nr:MAG: hypothetical protein UT38_C0006G0040 [Microgenomates group bacterium GW2011_GWA2_39_19]OGY06802.1 MAG: hypothetical protein A2694_00595 [Candidatus Blackburnbacteria bacterium RIFCSPHIGHO2_01_FULL_40_17]OGY09016.1 MAG: hypothetical protein A3D24_00815 [Candidatus Blackburnbacteria bacterium RIFCSPHIGHO2_02_FULL_39_13]OGY13684.1 MAG: hypothetical protein A3A77_01365 [Candidatus Blackburnbacteria bacterium RIFCSPLOWO2_01_FULL_40_20]OGY15086.1 MAG: hypothetical protein A3I52_03095 [Candida
MLALVRHFLVPHSSNNHRARIIHPSFVGFAVLFFILFQVSFSFLPQFVPVVLGYVSSITPEEIVDLTNKEREKNGVPTLTMDPQLTQAALSKAADMFARNYWAHNAPDGTEPWKFVVDSEYKYRYAGENLARDFSDSNSVVVAWMNSLSHKDNLLSSRYSDIGVAVVKGELKGIQTTLVVQFFGTKMGIAANAENGPKIITNAAQEASVAGIIGVNSSKINKSKQLVLSPFLATRKIALIVISLFSIIFISDMILIKHKNIQRISSRSIAHLLFLFMILAALVVSKTGLIL